MSYKTELTGELLPEQPIHDSSTVEVAITVAICLLAYGVLLCAIK